MGTGVLTEFLNETGRAWRDAATERSAVLADWRGGVEALLRTIREWVQERDTERLLEFRDSEVEIIEGRLGRYIAPALTVALGPRLVHFVPVARYTVATVPGPDGQPRRADGCVAVNTTQEVSAAGPNCRLYRAADPAGDRWYLAIDLPPYSELTRDVFERMLVGLMR